MKSGPLALSALASLSVAQAQVVSWNIEKRHPTAGLRRRADKTIQETVSNEQEQGGYFADVEIGGQKLSLQLDTGSSDVWVPYSGSDACADVTNTNPGCALGSYDPRKSDTYQEDLPGAFQIEYQDKSSATGDYILEEFVISGSTVNNLTMGLALKTDIPYGLVGVGYDTNEAILSIQGGQMYANLPVAMQKQGLVNTVAYSLWLNDLGASKGSIMFGGIDTEKYVGDLSKVKIIKDPTENDFVHFLVELTSLVATSSSGSDSLYTNESSVPVVLDSGTTLSYLPVDLVNQIYQEVGAQVVNIQGLGDTPLVPCSFANSGGHFSFGFGGPGGPRINVTMDELVMRQGTGPQQPFESGKYKGKEACEFGIQAQEDSPWLLGDTFLRSAYVVYDLINNEIGLAATDFNSTKSNVVAFASEGAQIPSATSAPEATASSAPIQQASPTSTNLTAANGLQPAADSAASYSRGGVTALFVTVGCLIFGTLL